MTSSRPWIAAICIVAALGLTACSGSSEGSQAASEVVAADMESVPNAAPEDSGGSSADRKIARTASLTVVVDDVTAAADQIRSIASTLAGTVTSESLQIDRTSERWPGSGSTVVVSVPAAGLDKAIDLLASVGTVEGRSVESVDVTDSVVDTEARIATLRASIKRLQDLMERAGSVADIAAVEMELTNRQSDLESMLAQQKSLNGMVESSTVTISLVTRSEVTPTVVTGFLPGLQAGWQGLILATQAGLTVLGMLLPFLAVLAAVVTPLVWWRRSRKAARARASSGSGSAGGLQAGTGATPGAAVPAAAASGPAAPDPAVTTGTQPLPPSSADTRSPESGSQPPQG